MINLQEKPKFKVVNFESLIKEIETELIGKQLQKNDLNTC